MLDQLIYGFDKALRALAGVHQSVRPSPASGIPANDSGAGGRRRVAALMRVNHVGEICAQALYQGQALASRDSRVRTALTTAASEEEDHLAWTRQSIAELGGRPSLLNPVWYAGSLAIGFAAGKCGERASLGFLAETERQVGEHLDRHLALLPPGDLRTRAVVEAMSLDEAKHRQLALRLGADALPGPIRFGMRVTARVMTSVAYWV